MTVRGDHSVFAVRSDGTMVPGEMALIACPDCARPVSDAAFSCPQCGHPFAPPDDHLSPHVISAFLRTVYEATVRPARFLARWTEEPRRYASPKRMLMASAVIAGFGVSFA